MQVVMSKDKLVEILKTNRAEHVEIYKEALAGYVIKVTEGMQTIADTWATKREIDMAPVSIQKPQSFESSYTDAIDMLEMTEESQLTLSQSEFKQYVQDRWQWTNNYVYSNSAYVTGAASASLTSKLI
jgi:hypothetical protein